MQIKTLVRYIKYLATGLAGCLLIILPGCKKMKTYPPETFFSGSQLMLAQAISRGDINEVKLLAAKTELNKQGKENMTLLFFALQGSFGEKPVQLQALTELVKAGADPIYEVEGIGTVAGACARAKSPLYMQALLNGGMDPNIMLDGSTPLIFDAASEHTIDVLKLLLANGADINKKDSLGATVIGHALMVLELDVIIYLLNHGADPHITNNKGVSFAHDLEYMIGRQGEGDTPGKRKMFEIRNKIISMGVSWPPPPAPWDKKP